jgi:4,5-DOPA dioxygenase extradiol
MGSGNLVHNLRSYVWEEETDPYDWAVRFETKIKEKMLAGEFESVINYQELGKEALLSVPTPDHYFPLLYVLAMWQQGEPITFPLEGMDGGSLSMLIVRIG